MKHRIALYVGLATLSVAGATSPQAQNYVEPPGAVPPPTGTLPPGPRVMYPAPQVESGGLPPGEILMIVRASGLRPLTQPARRGPQYVLLASDNMGGQLRVVVSAHNGRILHASPAYDPRFAYDPVRPRGLVPIVPPQHATAPPRYGTAPPPPDLNTPTPPLPRTARTTLPPQTPPAAAGSQKSSLASAPDTTGSVPTRPARTPLPRPRPAIVANEAGAEAPAPVQARQVVVPETSPEAEQASAAKPVPAAPSAAPARAPVAETQMVPVAPLD